MATASRKKAELSAHSEFLSAHAARIASIDAVRANELAEVDQARTRAETVYTRALEAAEVEHRAERLERCAAVVVESVAFFRTAWEAFTASHELGQAQIVGLHWRNQEAITERVLGRKLQNELAVAACEAFIAKHPEALAKLANPGAWIPGFGEGITFAAQRVAHAARQEFDLKAIQDSLLALEAAIGRTAAASYLAVADAEAHWAITAACLPGDVEEQRRLDIAKAAKARGAAAAVAERDLQFRAVQGDQAARDEIHARGPGELASVLRGAAQLFHLVTGRQPLAQEARALSEGRGSQ